MLGNAPIGRYAIGQTSVLLQAVVAETGAFVFTGNASIQQQVRKAGVGAFVLTGNAASRRISVVASVGAFTLGGQTARLLDSHRLVASPTVSTYGRHWLFGALGEFSLGGAVTGATQATTFALSGSNTVGFRGVAFSHGAGTFVFTGIDVALRTTAFPPKIRLFPRVGQGVHARGFGIVVNGGAGAGGVLAWNGEAVTWNGENLQWHSVAASNIRARAVGRREGVVTQAAFGA